MDADLPMPLVFEDVDLRDFAFMPLDVVRLRDSDLAAEETPEACWAAVLLWCASWHQVPAGSIPDSDQWQAKQAGYVARGKVDKAWDSVRSGALRNWVKCSDGRLYHPVIAEKAKAAWHEKQSQRARTEAARKAREAARQSLLHAMSQPQSQTPQKSVTETVTASKGEGEGEGEGEGIEIQRPSLLPQAPAFPPESRPDDAPQLSLVTPAPTPPKGPPDCPHQAVLALWAEVLPAMPQHNPAMWRGARADHLRARWRETAAEKRWATEADGLAYLRRLFGYVGQSEFLTGRTKPREPGRPAF